MTTEKEQSSRAAGCGNREAEALDPGGYEAQTRQNTAGYGDTPEYGRIRELWSIPEIRIKKNENNAGIRWDTYWDTFGIR